MSEPRSHAKSIFLEALELGTASEREAYLQTKCGSNAELRWEVEELLRHSEEMGVFLQSPPTAVLESAEEFRSAAPPSPLLDFLKPSSRTDSLGCLGHYEILDVVGSGGMGIVLKALDTQLQRIVAIKAMAPSLAASAAGRQRFIREAQAAAAVNHDNVVDIYAVEELNPIPFLVMEYISGTSLEDKLKQRSPLEVKEILRIGLQCADGLAAAHRQGLVHRDAKPANILLENGVGRVKITDFGLARAADDVSITQTGAIAGTPGYMSPEQARGDAIDHRSDLFSLGSVLYTMCAGRAPFRGSTSLGVLKRVCDETPHPIRDLNPEIPQWLSAIVERLHAKRPEERFQSAADLAETLGSYLAHLQQPSNPLPNALSEVHVFRPGEKSPEASTAQLFTNSRWLVAAALVALLFVGLSVSEATGVTRLVPTVLRIVTGEGTLVVETDPDVQVTMEGNGDLTFHLAGGQLIRVPTGRYHLKAAKGGKPIPLEENLIEIKRGREQVVRVRLDRTPNDNATLNTEQGAFVLLAAGKEQKFDTLAEAVLNANDGDTIEIRGNGPFAIESLVLKVGMTIRAGAGFHPVITDTRDDNAMRLDETLLRAEGSLNLEGLEILCTSRTYLILHAQGPLRVANCRFYGSRSPAVCIEMTTAAQICNCELLSPNGAALAFHCDSEASSIITNCLLVGHTNLQEHNLERGAKLRFTRNTFLSPANGIFLQIMWLLPDKFVSDPTHASVYLHQKMSLVARTEYIGSFNRRDASLRSNSLKPRLG